jgi:hypothetical protein
MDFGCARPATGEADRRATTLRTTVRRRQAYAMAAAHPKPGPLPPTIHGTFAMTRTIHAMIRTIHAMIRTILQL